MPVSKVLFFSPYSAIWRHAFPEALVAESLKKAGKSLVYVTCGAQLKDFCVAMRSDGLVQESPAEDKARVCRLCFANRDVIRRGFGFAGYDLASRLTAGDRAEIEGHLARITQDNYEHFELGGVSIGRQALFDFLLQHKKREIRFSDQEWSRFRILLRNAMAVWFAGRRILDEEKPDAVVVFDAHYSTNAVMHKLAEKRGISGYFLITGLSLSRRLQRIIFGKGYQYDYYSRLKDAWTTHKDLPCSPEELSAVTDHFSELFRGRNFLAYSAAKGTTSGSIREVFGIEASRRIIVATLSSYDEQMALEKTGFFPSDYKTVFKTQIEWVRSLIRRFKDHPEVFLIIRVHPREFPNKREGQKSEHAALLERELSDLPPNIRANLPSDGISIYDIAEEADVVLNSWSSVGKEMAQLGIPVVLYSAGAILYSPDINALAETEEEYYRAIDAALATGWDFERVRKTFRWHALEYVRSVLDISDACRLDEHRPPLWSRAVAKAVRKVDPVYYQKRDLRRRPERMKTFAEINAIIDKGQALERLREDALRARKASAEIEERDIRRELKRLLAAMYPDGGAIAPHQKLRARLTRAAEG